MIPIILSGGSGNRLWPISRKDSPKQFCNFFSESLFKQTFDRISELGNPLVISNINLKIPTENSLNQGLQNVTCLYEPISKNTAPAIALALHYLNCKDLSNEWVGVFPADHVIEDKKAFHDILKLVTAHQDNQVYLLGIKPREPKTGYGYIEMDNVQYNQICDVKRFHEKPNQETANKYFESGQFMWNSGIFIFKPKTIIEHFNKTQSEIWNQIKKIDNFSNFYQIYEELKGNSFDHEVLEKFDNIKCIPSDISWSDIGSWDEFSNVIDQPYSYTNEIVEIDSTNNYYFSNNKKVITSIGVDDLIIADSPDSLLICKKGSSEKVKSALQRVKNQKVLSSHNYELRPWGQFEVLDECYNYKVKKITIFPDHQLSYQSHNLRSEHWTITSGLGLVNIDGEMNEVQTGDFVAIPMKTKHRIKNIGPNNLEFIEIQTGSYFGEDDIIRYQDDYGRHQ